MNLRPLIAAFFLTSGATALVYQVIWVRMLGLVVGHSVFGMSTVVATYMAGLGIGAALAGRVAAKSTHPLSLYGFAEIAIGLFALASPWVLRGAEAVAATLGTDAHLLGTLGAAGLALLPPTLAMGATLPLLTRWYARDEHRLGRDMGWLYAINTTGAFAGAALAGFALLPSLGQPTSLALAAAANIAIGVGAVVLGRRHPLAPAHGPEGPPDDGAADTPAASPPSPALSPATRRAVLVAFAISGCAALIQQVAWTRSFGLFVGSTTYAFSLIVAAFIAGLALGGHVFARVVDRRPDRVILLAALNLGIALASALLIPLLGELPLLLITPLAALADSFVASQAFTFALLFALVLVPTVLMGGTYPAATRALADDPATAPLVVGRAYAWNTGGAIVGSAVGGLVLLPLIGLRNVLWLAVGLSLAAAGLLLFTQGRRAGLVLPLLALLGAVGAPPWNPRHMNLAPHMYAKDLADDPRRLAELRDGGQILFHEEGAGATVSVLQRETGARVLRINGKTDASTEVDRLYQGIAGTLPLLLSKDREAALVIGLGSGMSLANALDHPVKDVVAVELLPEVARGAELFGPVIGDPLADPRTDLVIGDGLHHLQRTDEQFDVVASQPTNLFVSGVATLFTVEAFEAMKARTKPGGVVSVWVQGYLLRDADFRMAVRTFLSVFDGVTLWSAGSFDYYLQAHIEPAQPLDRAELAARLAGLEANGNALWTGLREPVDLQRHYVLGDASLREWVGEGPIQHADDPFLEFTAPRGLYGGEGLLDVNALLALREKLPLDDPALEERYAAVTALDAAVAAGDGNATAAAVRLDPDNPHGQARLARASYEFALGKAMEGDLATAHQVARRATELQPWALPPWQLLAQIELSQNQPADAVQTLRRGVDEQPWNPYAWQALGDMQTAAGLDATEARTKQGELGLP